jgi:TolB-like protein/Tfp pilus assembly protein PilF
MGFVAELKRRNVIRMAGLYLVGAWLVTQVAGTVLPMFGAPEWLPRSVVVVLAIGFVPALVFAWVFELTPAGLKRDADVPPEQSIGVQTARRMERMFLLLLALALGYFAVDKFVLAPRRDAALVAATAQSVKAEAGHAAKPAISEKSIAVLPFVNMSADKDNEYFSDGIAEEILNALAQVKDLKVAGRTSSFQFKGRNENLTTIGETLGVAHVLEGSVRKQGDRVRITAQLIRAKDGYHQWSETYDGDLQDVFALQERIARAIADKLQLTLSGQQAQRLVDAGTANPEAYQLYLRASSTFDHRDREHMLDAVKQLEQAIELDPGYARAYSRLAAVHAILPTYAPGYIAKRHDNVETYARRALELDPRLGEPWAAMGLAANLYGSGLIKSRESFEKAVQLDPDDVTSNFWFGLTLARSGYRRAAVERIERALAIDPMVPNVMRWRGVLYLRDGNIDGAEQYLKRAKATGLRLADRELGEIAHLRGDTAGARRIWNDSSDPSLGQMTPVARKALAIAMFGGDAADRTRAVTAIEAYVASRPEFLPGIVPMWLAQIGQGARAMELDRTRSEVDNSDFMVYLFSPAGKSLRALPEFPAYLRAKGFPVLWDKYGPPDMCRKDPSGDYRCD